MHTQTRTHTHKYTSKCVFVSSFPSRMMAVVVGVVVVLLIHFFSPVHLILGCALKWIPCCFSCHLPSDRHHHRHNSSEIAHFFFSSWCCVFTDLYVNPINRAARQTGERYKRGASTTTATHLLFYMILLLLLLLLRAIRNFCRLENRCTL